ncbi:MAG: tryptophan halogenase family protein [Woeseiaceae bacterium]|nr:tryptophan halogenase family protein [Woeseiaceae bacterium]
MNDRIHDVVIVGGGTAGWITAALLIKILGKALRIRLVESEQIGIVGVGEATIPPILTLNQALGLDEAEFLRETKATFKLGIEFENWKARGDCYMHTFGYIGKDFPFCSFHHFWRRGLNEGREDSLWDYSLNYQVAKANRFAPVDKLEAGQMQGISYAYHFDAGLYAAYLRRYAERLGVVRTEGIIDDVITDPESGFITAVRLEDGTRIEGDLFVDCSGFRGLLIEQVLNAGYEDWTHWLPCDRAVAVPCESVEPILPYTRSIAHDAGWQWRIPLQHRIGNGLVYCSRYLSGEQAEELLLGNLDGAPLGDPRHLRFRTGRRIEQWKRNCVSVGLSSGFLEPLESTSIHLIQSAVIRLIKFFPHAGIRQEEVDEFNRLSKMEFEYVRDFIILHYHLNERDDSRFWQECRRMPIPGSLRRRMQLFGQSGKIFREQDELFTEPAWQQVLIGQGLLPQDYHPLVDALTPEQLDEFLDGVRQIIDRAVAQLPTHEQYLERLCSSSRDSRTRPTRSAS